MKKLGRNDPCPCGSGKKYKQCCLKAEEAQVAVEHNRSKAAPKALDWLFEKYSQAVHDAIDEGFLGGLNDDEYSRFQNLPEDSYAGIMINAMEWLLADGSITIKGREHRVAELLLGRGGPLFTVEQRHWIELLSTTPLRLYEIVGLVPGQSLTLKDMILPECPPILVREKTGSEQADLNDLIAARIIPVEDHLQLSGAVYPFPRLRGWELLEELKDELEGVEPDSALAKEITGCIIPDCWLRLFVSDVQIPQIIDHLTGEALLFVTDHYRVQDWDALCQALSGEVDIEGNREDGWSRIFEGEDGLIRRSLSIEKGKRSDQIKVSYHTQLYADKGRPWFEQVAGVSVAFATREISDPKGAIFNLQTNGAKKTPEPSPLPPV